MDENGNPQPMSCSNGSMNYSSKKQLRPLSIYRHNPAFHASHVSVNPMDEIPSPPESPPRGQMASGGQRMASPSAKAAEESTSTAPGGAAKIISKRRKKKVV